MRRSISPFQIFSLYGVNMNLVSSFAVLLVHRFFTGKFYSPHSIVLQQAEYPQMYKTSAVTIKYIVFDKVNSCLVRSMATSQLALIN